MPRPGFAPGVRKEMRALGVERVAPGKALSFEAPARGPLPLGLGGQSHGLARLLGKPRAKASRVVETHERHGMALAPFGRRAVVPEVSSRDRAEIGFVRTRYQRQRANGRRQVAGLADKLGILGVGDRALSDREIVNVDAMNGPLVLVAVVGAHDEFARGDPRHLQQRFVSHLLWVECI